MEQFVPLTLDDDTADTTAAASGGFTPLSLDEPQGAGTPEPQPEQPADISITIQPEIMQNPEAAAVITELQQQWGGAAPIFAPGDEREAIWNTYREQTNALQSDQPNEQFERQGKKLIPGDAQNGILAGLRDAAANTGDFVGDVISAVGFENTGNTISEASKSIPKVRTEGPAGDISRTLTRYVAGAAGAGKFKALGKLGAAAVGDFVVTGENDTGLSEMGAEALIEAHPGLEGPILDYLAAPDKGEFDKRFIAALEGVLLTKAAESVFKFVRHLKGSKEGGETTLDEVIESARQADEAAPAADDATAPAAPVSGNLVEGYVDGRVVPRLEDGQSPRYLYRVMSQAEYEAGIKQGSFTPGADGRTHASGAPEFQYVEPGDGNVLVRIDYDDADGWKAKLGGETFYGITDNGIPASKVHKLGAGTREQLEQVDLSAPIGSAQTVKQIEAIELDAASKEVFLRNLDLHGGSGDLPPMPEGVLNWNRMDSADSVKNVWHTLTETIDGHLAKQTGGVRSHESEIELAQELAEDIGVSDFRTILGPLQSLSDDATKITGRLVAAKQISQSLAREIHDLAVKIDNGVGGAAAEVEMLRRIDLLTEFTSMVKGAQTAAARMTSAGRIRTADNFSADELVKLVDESGGAEAVSVLARRIRATGGKAAHVNKVLSGGIIGKMIDVHNEVYISGILSGVKTHLVNITSNIINTGLRPAQKVLGGALSGNREVMAEGLAQYSGMRMAMLDSLELAVRAWKMEGNVLDISHKTIDGFTHAISKGDGKFIGGEAWERIKDGDVTASWELMINGFGKFVRMPSRFLMAEDEFFKQLNYRGHVFAQAHRTALAKGFDPKGAEYQHHVETFFGKQFDEAGRGTNTSALRWAQESTFTNDLKADTWRGGPTMSESIHKLGNKHPLFRGLVMPFIRTPANLMRNVWDHAGPLAALRKQFHSDLKAGGERRAMALGKMASGSMMWMTAVGLAAEGRITGGGPSDPAARKEWMAAGNRPYSLTMPGGEVISYQRLDPFASILGMAADYWELSDQVDQELVDQAATTMSIGLGEVLWKKAGSAGTAFVSNVAGKSYLTGLTETLGLISRGQMNREKMTELMINKRAAAYIPSYMQMYTADPELKEIRSTLDALKARSPYHSNEVEAKRDYLGQKILRDGGGFMSQVNPFAAAEPLGNKVRDEVTRLGQERGLGVFQDIPEKVGGVDLSEWKNAKGQSAYDRLQELMGTITNGRGETLEQQLERKITSGSYQRLADPITGMADSKKVQMLQETRNRFKDRAMRRMLKEKGFRDLADALKIDKRNRRRASRHGLNDLIKLPEAQ